MELSRLYSLAVEEEKECCESKERQKSIVKLETRAKARLVQYYRPLTCHNTKAHCYIGNYLITGGILMMNRGLPVNVHKTGYPSLFL